MSYHVCLFFWMQHNFVCWTNTFLRSQISGCRSGILRNAVAPGTVWAALRHAARSVRNANPRPMRPSHGGDRLAREKQSVSRAQQRPHRAHASRRSVQAHLSTPRERPFPCPNVIGAADDECGLGAEAGSGVTCNQGVLNRYMFSLNKRCSLRLVLSL